MKKLTTLLTLILVSFNSYGVKWSGPVATHNGNSFYIDFSKITQGYEDQSVYWFDMIDFAKADKHGYLSVMTHHFGDCKENQYYTTTHFFSKQPMMPHNAVGETRDEDTDFEWVHPDPRSIGGLILKSVCRYLY